MSKRQLEAAFLKGKVAALQEHGESDRKISSSVGVPRSTIYKWKRSNFSLHRKPGSGRPRKTCPQSDDSIVSLARSDPNMSSSEIRQGSEANVSARTVQHRLREADFRSLKRPSAVELTVTNAHVFSGPCATATGVLNGIESFGVTRPPSISGVAMVD